MKKYIPVVVLLVLLAGLFAWKKNSPTNIPAPTPAPTPTPSGETTSLPGFTLPPGFSMSIFAKDLPGARVIAFDSDGNMWVSQTREGKITKLEIENGKVISQNAIFRNLNRPHGLVIDGNTLYFAEETKVTRVALNSEDKGKKIVDLPTGGSGHFTRTLLLGPDDRLYVSIGSTCNVCHEEDTRNASIYSMKKDGTDFKKVASGLRNSVFMAINPVDGKIFATEMGRDNLGDKIPPDEINIITGPSKISGQSSAVSNFGWPNCYGKNIHDAEFDKNTYIRNPCMEFSAEGGSASGGETPSFIDLPAHSAPLGIAFVPEEGWPEEYWYNALVAYHGSWNSSVPTGYKIVRLKINAKGEYSGTEDFITGWLKDGDNPPAGGGRPVDIKVFPGGTAYISDDEKGVIYRLWKSE